MKYIVYITENINKDSKINGIIRSYIGIHEVENPDVFDGYLGSGVYTTQANTFMYPKTPFQYAVKKYGVKSFRRKTLYITDSIVDAIKKYNSIVTEDYLKQSHVYNYQLLDTRPLYQFSLDGEMKHKWKYSFQAYDFYGQNPSRFKFMIYYKHEYLNSYWSRGKEIDVTEYQPKKNIRLIFLYDSNGKLVKDFSIEEYAADYLGLTVKQMNTFIKNQMLYNNTYYISNRLTDRFISKPRANYLHTKIHVYEKDKGYLGCYEGKPIMKVIGLHSWRKIKNALTINNGWYKDFYLSLEYVDQIPEKKAKGIRIDVYDTYGNYIETLSSINKTREKYNIPSAKFKDIQQGSKFYDGFIFKYNSRN